MATTMKLALALAFTAALAGPAWADQALATAKNCMTCHAVDKDVLGPSFRKIAVKYANDKGAADRLAVKIVKGGGGVWGTAVMPANPQVTEAEAKKLALWALSQK
jgi:cytochrome c